MIRFATEHGMHAKDWLPNLEVFFSAVLLVLSLTIDTAKAAVVVTFTGTVTYVGGVGATPPAGVAVGGTVGGMVVYNTVDASEVWIGPSQRYYAFPPASGNEITIVIGPHVWKADLSIEVCNDQCGGDSLGFLGLSATTVNFPSNLGDGVLLLEFSDSEAPFTLLDGHDLPSSAEDIQFDAEVVKAGQVNSGDGVVFWGVLFDVHSLTVPVRASTWGEIKALYARPQRHGFAGSGDRGKR